MTAEQLRNSILQEAISGRLVPQDPNDEPASALLACIREEKARLVKEGKLKKKDLVETPITEDEIPFEIPDSWEWCRFGNIVINRDSERIPLSVEQRSKLKKEYDYYGASGVIDKVESYLFDKDLLLIGEDGANLINRSTPIAFIAHGKYWVNNHAHVIDCINETFMRYICTYINAISLVKYVTGTAQPKMNQEKMNSILVSVPPLEEQKRIVAKLEELLPIVEQYGKAQKELDELNAALPARLRHSILQEAIHGKLVPQDEKEGTAEELLKLIDAEKQRLVKERILKKAIRTSAIIPEDSPFEIPTSWLWANLEDVTYAVGGRENQILSKEILKEGKIRVVSQGQAIYDGYCNDATKEINDLPVILFGDHTRNVKYIDFPFVIGADGTKLFRPIGIYPRYLYYWMKYAASTLRNRGYARHYTLLKVVPVPLPPLAEQERIVAKIEELFAEIDKIRK